MKVVILGTGNVATVLGKKILQAKHEVLQVYGREILSAESLATALGAKPVQLLAEITNDADIYIIAVSDAAIQLIADQLRLPGKIVVHTAAAVSKTILQNVTGHYGVVYPLQSLRKTSGYIPVIPVFIDGSDEKTLNSINQFSNTVFEKTTIANDDERLKLHVAAVLVSNFTNHLYALADYFCGEEKLDFNSLLPLMHESVERLNTNKPLAMQTGPAVRSDLVTIETHLDLLENYPHIKEVYDLLTRSIIDLHRHSV
jgi:predicted short-subunit dehydrogenase-like oxidoreductase (DUF2520 family)